MVYIFSKIVFVIAFGSSSDIKTSCSLGFWQSTHSNWAFSVKLCRFDQIQMEWCVLLFQNNTTIPHLRSSWPHFYVHIHFVSNSDIGEHQWFENRKDKRWSDIWTLINWGLSLNCCFYLKSRSPETVMWVVSMLSKKYWYEGCAIRDVISVDFWVPDTRLGTKYSWVLEYHLSIRSVLE